MKNIIFMLLLLCAGLLQAQEFSYSITPEGGGTFTLDVITELSDTREDISRTTGLDTAGIRSLLYPQIERIRQEQARLETQILKGQRKAATLLQALNSQGLNDYNLFQREKLDSFYVNSSGRNGAGWVIANSAGYQQDLKTVYREGNTTVLRNEANVNLAAIVPLSSNNIVLNFLLSDPLITDATVQLYSENGRVFRGESATGVRYTLVRL